MTRMRTPSPEWMMEANLDFAGLIFAGRDGHLARLARKWNEITRITS